MISCINAKTGAGIEVAYLNSLMKSLECKYKILHKCQNRAGSIEVAYLNLLMQESNIPSLENSL